MKTSSNKTSSRKSKSVQAVPTGFNTITPFIMVDNAESLIDFIEGGLNGNVEFKMKNDDGRIMHASVRVGNSPIMISDVMDGQQPITSMLYLYVDNADELYEQALSIAGTKSARELRDEFYGDRAGCVEDQWGNKWWIATHIEDVSKEELESRKSKLMSEHVE
jgi:uncharacterized glyoxalase superfamily protein PhnB